MRAEERMQLRELRTLRLTGRHAGVALGARATIASPMNSSRSTDVAGVLAEIAAAASEPLELQAVFDRVAASIRRLIPCDHVGVVRILDGDWVVMHATTFDCGESGGK
jgi:hypothetical protein